MDYQFRIEVPNLPPKALVVAIALAFSSTVSAEGDDEVTRLIKPESTISFGLGHVSGDNQRFGMYNGLNEAGYVGLVDFSINLRNEESGTWYRAFGRNLGLDNREFRLEHERQGSWGYFVDYNEITRNTPYTVRTNVSGIESDYLTVPSSSGATSKYTLKTERQKTSFGFNTSFLSNFEFKLLVQNEEREGQRLFGRGTGTVQEFLVEPINSTTRQFDLVLDYTGENLQLSGGYYGSFFNNSNPVLEVSGGNAAFNSGVGTRGVAFDNISLPPDNHAHQFHLAGGYQFSKATRMNFKVAKTMAIQNEDFMAVRFFHTANNGANANSSGRTDLGGRLDTTLVNLGLTSRPIKDLFLLANLRYEDRDDKTAVARYITTVGGTGAAPTFSALTGTSTTDGYNEPRSLTNRSGKLEASYLLPKSIYLTGGFDIDQKERTMAGVRVVGYREKTEENTYRLEVKRVMAETLSGSLAYLHSERDGSDYKDLVTLSGTTNYPNYSSLNCGQAVPAAQLQVTRCGLLQPIYIADRERDKLRWMMDWSPLEQLSVQLMIEGAKDSYESGRGAPDIGVRKGEARLYSIDLAYSLSDNWKLNSWFSRSEASIDQATIGAAPLTSALSNAAALVWSSTQKNTVNSVGFGIRGKLPRGFDIGADYIFANDKTRYGMQKEQYAPFTSSAVVGDLPDITYRQNSLRLFGTYAYAKNTKFRLDYAYDNRRIDDWTWSGWQYSDGTRIVQNPQDVVHFVGLSVSYSFQ